MTCAVGIDPGLSGCIAVNSDGRLSLYDIPTYKKTINKSERNVFDVPAIVDLVGRIALLYAPELWLIEKVQGMTGQSASAAFQFGWGAGMLYGVIVATGQRVELIDPQSWKPKVRVMGKGGAKDARIVERADSLFPGMHNEWRGPRGGLLLDRAEAALISHVARTML